MYFYYNSTVRNQQENITVGGDNRLSEEVYYMDILSKFTETFNFLISDNDLTGKELAAALNIPAATVSRYRNGIHAPTIDYIIKIADYFNCSVDYLLGLEEENTALTFKRCPPIKEQIAALPKQFKMSYYAFCKQAGITESGFYDWKNGNKTPTIQSIVKIAKFFDRRVDFILGRES